MERLSREETNTNGPLSRQARDRERLQRESVLPSPLPYAHWRNSGWSLLEATERCRYESPVRCPLPKQRTAIDIDPTLRQAWPRDCTRGRNVRSRYRCSMCPAIHINSRS